MMKGGRICAGVLKPAEEETFNHTAASSVLTCPSGGAVMINHCGGDNARIGII